MLQRTGLRDTLFIAMSNYYYEEKSAYLTALSDTRQGQHDLTPFLKFALKGVETQCRRLLAEIREQVAKALFRNTVTDLFGRLKSPRSRVPAVALTAHARPEDRARALESGFNMHVSKPIETERLIGLLQASLRGGLK